jgi:DHA1 family bicyclomycin/chloramphenicol resistance-like MFS transporter
MHSTVLLAAASLAMMSVGLLAWVYLRQRWPEIGRADEVAATELAH